MLLFWLIAGVHMHDSDNMCGVFLTWSYRCLMNEVYFLLMLWTQLTVYASAVGFATGFHLAHVCVLLQVG